jgi:hypothetical protein
LHARGKLAISGWFDGHEMQSFGLSFSDYGRMHTARHKQSGERRLPTPEWALDDLKTRAAIARFYERRAGFRYPMPGSDQERLQRAHTKLLAEKPRLNTTLDKLCAEYAALKRDHADPERQRVLELQIQNLDAQLSMLARGPALIAGVVYLYYRRRADCVGVSQELGGQPSPCCIRKMLWRLNEVQKRMADEESAPAKAARYTVVRSSVRYTATCKVHGATAFYASCVNCVAYTRSRDRSRKAAGRR